MEIKRKPFQGVYNIVRFNWHFFAISLAFVLLFIFVISSLKYPYSYFFTIVLAGIIITNFISLFVSWYVYDVSGLYSLKWLDEISIAQNGHVVNIHAGFDETSELLHHKYTNSQLTVLDFYDPVKHTEVSIKRARKAYPSYPGTLQVVATKLPLSDSSVDSVFAILSAHEIRNDEERAQFFKEIKRITKPEAQIIVTEHLRDVANFLAYNIGFFHFHSKNTWYKTFSSSGFYVSKEIKITPFITTFILSKNGTSS